MLTITQLIAVLFKVITLITMNPNIPQDVKDQVVAEVIQVVGQETEDYQPTEIPQTPQPVVETPVVGIVVEPEITIGTPVCSLGDSSKTTVEIPISASTDKWNYGLATSVSNKGTQRTSFNRNYSSQAILSATNNGGTTTIMVELGKGQKSWNDNSPITEYSKTEVLFVGNYCN